MSVSLSLSLKPTDKKIYDSIISDVNSIDVIQKDRFFNIETKLDEFLTYLDEYNEIREANKYLTKIQSIINQLIIRYNGKTGGLFGRDDTKLKIRINELFKEIISSLVDTKEYNLSLHKNNPQHNKNGPVDLDKINMESVISNSNFSGGIRTRRKNRRNRRCKTRSNRKRKRRSSHRR
jgi:hypothetical protein